MRKGKSISNGKLSPSDELEPLLSTEENEIKEELKQCSRDKPYKERLLNNPVILKLKDGIQYIRECNAVFSVVQSLDIYSITMSKPAYITYLVIIFLLVGINIWALVLGTNVFFSKQTYGSYFWLVEPMHISSIILLLILIVFLSCLYIRQDYSISVKIGAVVSIFAIHICVVILYILQRFSTNIIINTRAKILKYLIFTQVVITYTTIFIILVMYFILSLVKK